MKRDRNLWNTSCEIKTSTVFFRGFSLKLRRIHQEHPARVPSRHRQDLSSHHHHLTRDHYNDVIMSTIASQVTSLMIVYSTVYSGTDERKHQSSAPLALWGEFTGDRWIPRAKDQ